MRFMVYRQGYYDSNRVPIDGAYRASYVRIDERTVSDPRRIDAHKGEDPAWWYNEGRNHRVERRHIKRDFDAEGWFVDIPDLAALLRLWAEFGTILIEPAYTNRDIPMINISGYYD